ncbi:hypothetical protein BH10BDE1_BH10BDE1_25710 [soil metagenome]
MRLCCVLILSILSFSTPSWAKERSGDHVTGCLADYQQMASVAFGPKLGRSQGFNFKDEKMIYGRPVQLRFVALPKKTISAEFQRISDQDRYLRQHLGELKRESTRRNRPQREMQEFIVVYRDGTRKSVRYTSNQIHEVAEGAGNAAVGNSGIFTDDIATVIDIHTHPDQGLRSDLFFSSDDVTGSRDMKAQLERAIKRKIKYQMILAPTCSNCGDVILTTSF